MSKKNFDVDAPYRIDTPSLKKEYDIRVRTPQRAEYLRYKSVKRQYRDYRLARFVTFLRVLALVFCIVLFVRLFWSLRGSSSNLTFTGLLDWFSNLNSLDVNVDVGDYVIRGDWGIFNGFKNFLNIFTQSFGVIVWLFSNFLNLLLYCVSFVRFLFS